MNPIRQSAIDTINAEAAAVQHLVEQLTDDFEKAVQAILACKGKVIVTGMGKSGLIGKKIAATLASRVYASGRGLSWRSRYDRVERYCFGDCQFRANGRGVEADPVFAIQ